MASNETEMINVVLPWILGIIAIIGAIYAGFKVVTKYLICKGLNKANGDNWKKDIEKRVSDIVTDFDKFKKWAYEEHADMNAEVERKFSKLQEDVTEIKQTLGETNGYLKRLAEEKTS